MASGSPDPLDCIVIGAGPAGLSAAIYLARYRRSVLVLHDGTSRASRIPKTFNVPGFPDGVPGPDLLARMTDQARRYGARIETAGVEAVTVGGTGFRVASAGRSEEARTVILATGVCLRELDMPHDLHETAIGQGCLRYCPICDGFEAADRAVGVFGNADHGPEEALFLRQFTDRVTLISAEGQAWTGATARKLAEAGIAVVTAPVRAFEPGEDGMTVRFAAGAPPLRFDVLYPALGADARSVLAGTAGVDLTEAGCIPTDPSQGTNVPGLFAAGDVVLALDQISVAMGHGAVAATNAHNHLRRLDGHTLAETAA